jgi:hypothetical protein
MSKARRAVRIFSNLVGEVRRGLWFGLHERDHLGVRANHKKRTINAGARIAEIPKETGRKPAERRR